MFPPPCRPTKCYRTSYEIDGDGLLPIVLSGLERRLQAENARENLDYGIRLCFGLWLVPPGAVLCGERNATTRGARTDTVMVRKGVSSCLGNGSRGDSEGMGENIEERCASRVRGFRQDHAAVPGSPLIHSLNTVAELPRESHRAVPPTSTLRTIDAPLVASAGSSPYTSVRQSA